MLAIAIARVAVVLLPQVTDGLDGATLARWVLIELGQVGLLTFVPAAIMIGRPDAWRSARLVVVGAIVWTTIPALTSMSVQVAYPLLGSPAPTVEVAHLYRVLSILDGVATVAAYAGPVLVAIGLERLRPTGTIWPRPLVIASLGLVGLATVPAWSVIFGGPGLFNWGGDYQPSLGDTVVYLEHVCGQALSPIAIVGPAILGWISLSAWRAGEKPSRLWACLFAASIAFIPVTVFFGWPLSLFAWDPSLAQSLTGPSVQNVVGMTLVAAAGLFLWGFTADWAPGEPQGPWQPAATARPGEAAGLGTRAPTSETVAAGPT